MIKWLKKAVPIWQMLAVVFAVVIAAALFTATMALSNDDPNVKELTLRGFESPSRVTITGNDAKNIVAYDVKTGSCRVQVRWDPETQTWFYRGLGDSTLKDVDATRMRQNAAALGLDNCFSVSTAPSAPLPSSSPSG